ncbi:MAG: hypothetical protein IKT17_09880 [Lachnospiraceae bacterium]|nr:hypothetical protein [Lachnospiraceae bacterium]
MKIDNMREEHQEKLFKISENSKGDTEYVEISESKATAESESNRGTEVMEEPPQNRVSETESVTANEPEPENVAADSSNACGSDTVTADNTENEEAEDNVEITEYNDEPEEAAAPTHEEVMRELSGHKDIGFISVSMGSGMESIFKGLGVDEVISGGQTMNPSTEDMLKAVSRINADNIFILPNNKNIIMAANQVQYMSDDKKIYVIPTKTVPQGITALINYTIGMSAEENDKAMKESIAGVKTGQVTYAVRDTVVNGLSIKRGNIMGIGDRDILSIGDSIHDTSIEMIEKMVDDSSELISIYYGRDTDPQDADDFNLDVAVRFPKCDVEMHYGGQPIYYYVISVE